MKRILLTLSLLFTAAIGWSQCSASFYADSIVYSDTVVFFNTSDTGSGITYYWFFQGGTPGSDTTTSLSESPVVSYDSTGTYQACLVLVNTNLSCLDSFCQTVNINFLNANVTPTNTTCGACNGSASANATGGIWPYDYLWSNGSTTPTLTNLCAGTYTVTVVDDNGDSAVSSVVVGASATSNISVSIALSDTTPCGIDTVYLNAMVSGTSIPYTFHWSNGNTTSQIFAVVNCTRSVTVTDTNGCSVSDTVDVVYTPSINVNMSTTNETCSGCCDGTATPNPTGGSGNGFAYQWSTGATTSSINGLCPGAYYVTITDIASGCDTTDSFLISAASCYHIAGLLNPGASDARLYLIEENSGVLTAIDSMDVDSFGIWHFSGVCPGTYYVKGALLPSHPQYSNYLPAYYDSVALWSNATAIVVSNTYINNLDFSLIPGTNPGGPGFIGGLISQGANRAEGDPVAKAQVILYNSNDEVVAFTKTDENGEYTLDNLPLGSYKIHVDILNKVSNAYEVSLTSENQEVYNRNFIVTGNQIKPVFPAGIEGIHSAGVEMYPNPTTGTLFIHAREKSIQSVTVFNLVGTQVYHMAGITGKDVIQVDLEGLVSGQYIMELEGEHSTWHQPVIIIE